MRGFSHQWRDVLLAAWLQLAEYMNDSRIILCAIANIAATACKENKCINE